MDDIPLGGREDLFVEEGLPSGREVRRGGRGDHLLDGTSKGMGNGLVPGLGKVSALDGGGPVGFDGLLFRDRRGRRAEENEHQGASGKDRPQEGASGVMATHLPSS